MSAALLMTGDMSARIAAMTQTLNELKSMHSRVAASANNGNAEWWSTASFSLLYEAVRRVTGVSSVRQGVDDALKVTRQGISILEGTTRTEAFGNLYESAMLDDAAMSFWLEYAQQIGETLALALGLASYDVSRFFGSVSNNVKEMAKDTASGVSSSLPWIAIIAVAVVVIIILK